MVFKNKKALRARDFKGNRMKAKKKTGYRLTEKGIAIMAAIESGLLPKVEGGWDNTAFLKFWELFCNRRRESLLGGRLQDRNNKASNRNKKA